MTPILGLLALVVVTLPGPALGGTTSTSPQPVDAADPADLDVEVVDRLLVRWEPGTGQRARARVLADVAAGGFPDADLAPVTRRVDALHLPGAELAAATARLQGHAEVEMVEPDQVLTPASREPTWVRPATVHVGPTDDAPAPFLRPDDPLFDLQWGLESTGQLVGPPTREEPAVPGNDVRLLEAWEVTRGSAQVTVAVIDGAVDQTHPDLAGAVVGEVDLADGAPASRVHGTAVASVIAARADDGIGMAGVAPEVGILSVAAFSGGDGMSPGSSTIARVVAGFEAAADLGADVITASWVTGQDSALLHAAVADAGVPVVAASGNNGRSLTRDSRVFPATYDLSNLVAVTAIGPSGLIPAFANIGAEVVDVAAPGEHVLAAVEGSDHAWVDGTSFAVPHVAGALALARNAAPYASAGELVDAVRWTSRAAPTLVDLTVTGGTLDAAALVTGVQRPACRPDRQPEVTFTDLSADNVHRSNIACLVDRGLLSGRGDGSLQPGSAVTREQVASLLDRIISSRFDQVPAPPAGFVDVDPASVHAPAVDRLADLGLLQGDGQRRFRPRDPVTRAQFATMLMGTYDLVVTPPGEGPAAPSPPARVWFRDTAGSIHAPAVHRARDLGLVAGTGRLTFEPTAPIRRDGVASLLARALDALERHGEGRDR